MDELNAAPGVAPINGRRRARKKPLEPAKPKRLVLKIRDHDSLAGLDMRFLWLNHWNLSGRDLRRANLRGARLNGANLSASDLRDAVLEAADLSGACLRGTLLKGADLRSAVVTDADFREALTDH